MINDDQHASHEKINSRNGKRIPAIKSFLKVKLYVSWLQIFYYRKPVYVIGAELCTWKFADFQNSLQKQGVARPFTGMENVSLSAVLECSVFFVCLGWYQFFYSECTNHRINYPLHFALMPLFKTNAPIIMKKKSYYILKLGI
jgi:hypothetical protein